MSSWTTAIASSRSAIICGPRTTAALMASLHAAPQSIGTPVLHCCSVFPNGCPSTTSGIGCNRLVALVFLPLAFFILCSEVINTSSSNIGLAADSRWRRSRCWWMYRTASGPFRCASRFGSELTVLLVNWPGALDACSCHSPPRLRFFIASTPGSRKPLI
jgi:hypothetical protein